jgi:hypothetical protein
MTEKDCPFYNLGFMPPNPDAPSGDVSKEGQELYLKADELIRTYGFDMGARTTAFRVDEDSGESFEVKTSFNLYRLTPPIKVETKEGNILFVGLMRKKEDGAHIAIYYSDEDPYSISPEVLIERNYCLMTKNGWAYGGRYDLNLETRTEIMAFFEKRTPLPRKIVSTLQTPKEEQVR